MNIPTQAETHSFNVDLAMKYGVGCAIVLGHIAFWIGVNKRNGTNYKDGRTWTYQTRKEIAAAMPYYSPDQVRRFTDELVEKGVLIKGNYNKCAIDKTIWYAFADEEKSTTGKSANGAGKSANGAGKSAKPIPDTNKDAENKNDEREPVVVPSFLQDLGLSTSDQEKFAKIHQKEPERVQKAATVLRQYKGPINPGAVIQAAYDGNWKPSKSREDVTEKNIQWKDSKVKPYDGKNMKGYTVHVGPTYIEFVSLGQCAPKRFEVTQADFIDQVKAFVNKLNK